MTEIISGAEAIDKWSIEALTTAAIAERNYQLFRSFIESLGEVALRVDLEIDLGEDS